MKYNYKGKKVFVGIDVHKKTYSLTAICEGIIIKKDTIQAFPNGLVAYLKRYFPEAKIESAYEAGFSGFYLHRFLISHGIDNKVVHAAGIEISSRDRVKTDKRDSMKIAVQLSVGRLQGIYVVSKKREEYRSITRLREVLIRHQTRIACQIKGFLYYYNFLPFDHKFKISKKGLSDLLQKEFPDDIKYCINTFANIWLEYQEKIKALEVRLKNQAKEDEVLEMTYRSAPGVGITIARVLANELGDMSQFSNEKKLFSYTGLTPCEYSSGDQIRLGHISRQGKPILRKVLVQAAWIAIRDNQNLRMIFENIAKKSGKKRAIIGVARRLIGHIRACFIKEELYKIEKQFRVTSDGELIAV